MLNTAASSKWDISGPLPQETDSAQGTPPPRCFSWSTALGHKGHHDVHARNDHIMLQADKVHFTHSWGLTQGPPGSEMIIFVLKLIHLSSYPSQVTSVSTEAGWVCGHLVGNNGGLRFRGNPCLGIGLEVLIRKEGTPLRSTVPGSDPSPARKPGAVLPEVPPKVGGCRGSGREN